MERAPTSALVIGAGAVGTFAAAAIAQAGATVVVADVSPPLGYFARYGPRDADLVPLDATREEDVRGLIRRLCPRTIVLAVGAMGKTCEGDHSQAWLLNSDVPALVAAVASASEVQHLVYVSSLSVYGRASGAPVDEDTPLRPITEYGRSKASGEARIAATGDGHLVVSILRFCGLYGPIRFGTGSRSARLLERLLLRAVRDGTVELAADNRSKEQYLYVKDAAAAIAGTVLSRFPASIGICNVAAEKAVDAMDLKEAVEVAVPGASVNVTLRDEPPPNQPILLNAAKSRRVLRFEPRYPLAEGLADYCLEAGWR